MPFNQLLLTVSLSIIGTIASVSNAVAETNEITLMIVSSSHPLTQGGRLEYQVHGNEYLVLRGTGTEIKWKYTVSETYKRESSNSIRSGSVKGNPKDLQKAFENIIKLQKQSQSEGPAGKVPSPLFFRSKKSRAKPEGKVRANKPVNNQVKNKLNEDSRIVFGNSFSLLLIDGNGIQSSIPLSTKERKLLLEEETLEGVFTEIRSKKMFTKVNYMRHLWAFNSYPREEKRIENP